MDGILTGVRCRRVAKHNGGNSLENVESEHCSVGPRRIHSNCLDVRIGTNCQTDETEDPPEWKCQDFCLFTTDDGLFCGETDHVTNFAILLNGAGAGSASRCRARTRTGSLANTGETSRWSCASSLLASLSASSSSSWAPSSAGQELHRWRGRRVPTCRS